MVPIRTVKDREREKGNGGEKSIHSILAPNMFSKYTGVFVKERGEMVMAKTNMYLASVDLLCSMINKVPVSNQKKNIPMSRAVSLIGHCTEKDWRIAVPFLSTTTATRTKEIRSPPNTTMHSRASYRINRENNSLDSVLFNVLIDNLNVSGSRRSLL